MWVFVSNSCFHGWRLLVVFSKPFSTRSYLLDLTPLFSAITVDRWVLRWPFRVFRMYILLGTLEPQAKVYEPANQERWAEVRLGVAMLSSGKWVLFAHNWIHGCVEFKKGQHNVLPPLFLPLLPSVAANKSLVCHSLANQTIAYLVLPWKESRTSRVS